MLSIKFQGYISNDGKLCPDNVELLREWLSAHAGERIELSLGKPKEPKTLQQLGYLFGHVIPQIAMYTGYTDDEVYAFLKSKYLSEYILSDLGAQGSIDTTLIVKSLSECSKEEVSKFITQCVEFGQSLGADIYPPEHYKGEL